MIKEVYIKKIVLLSNTKFKLYRIREEDKVNGNILKDKFDDSMISINNNMGLICIVNDTAIVIKRIIFWKNKYFGDDWIIDVFIN